MEEFNYDFVDTADGDLYDLPVFETELEVLEHNGTDTRPTDENYSIMIYDGRNGSTAVKAGSDSYVGLDEVL